ncbi:MAG: protein-(glutamine-N5) methyltransferase, release factor-specific, partial [bacterium]|nr:protein-(glutamine-N5) methyltransferase, release factor-specific [bacterium]
IKANAVCTLAKEVREFEPHLALVGSGDDGLLLHKRIIELGISLLKADGWLLLEIGFDQKEEIATWASSKDLNFNFIKDDANHNRIICIKNREKS